MRTIAVAAISVDGYLTKGTNPNPSSWTSEEDKNHYHNMLHRYDVYLMGSKTYQVAKNALPANAHKIVMSHNVSEQPKAAGVTFTDKSFRDILSSFEGKTSEILVLGGASVFHQLLEQKLIDEAYITIEPVRNGSGVQLSTHGHYFEDKGFTLSEEKQLNNKGTLLKHYILKK